MSKNSKISWPNINYLKIPASVNECSISNCIFMDLSFEPSNIELKLTYSARLNGGKLLNGENLAVHN